MYLEFPVTYNAFFIFGIFIKNTHNLHLTMHVARRNILFIQCLLMMMPCGVSNYQSIVYVTWSCRMIQLSRDIQRYWQNSVFSMAIDIMTFIDYIEYAFSISTFKVNDINFMRLRFLWKKFVYVASLNIYKR